MLKYGWEVDPMQVITKITQQKRSSNRWNVFLNGTYAFSVSEDVYAKFQLYKGKELSAEEIEQIKRAEHLQKNYAKALHYLSYRMRTEAEMRKYLQDKEVMDESIDKIIDKLYRGHLLNDRKFAKSFVSDRINRSKKGPKLVREELSQKGVPKAIIDDSLQAYTPDIQWKKAYEIAKKEAGKSSKHPLQKRKEQLKARLLRRGFTSDLVFEVVQEINFEVDDEEEQLLLKKEANKLYTRYQNKYDEVEMKLKIKQRLYSRGFELKQIDTYLDQLFTE